MTGSRTARKAERLHVVQGDQAVSDDPNVVITTLLGSCIAACLYDVEARIGGLNHFLLPGAVNNKTTVSNSYGVNAMELLINDLLRRGARRDRLRAKLFGGSSMHEGLTSTDIGGENAAFARKFLENENIPVVGGSTGGVHARRIEFWPTTGRARQAILERDEDKIFAAEKPVAKPKGDVGGDLELF